MMPPILLTAHRLSVRLLRHIQVASCARFSLLNAAAACPRSLLLFAIPNGVAIALLLFFALPNAKTSSPLIVMSFEGSITSISIVGGGFYRYSDGKKVPLRPSQFGRGEGTFVVLRKGSRVPPSHEIAKADIHFSLYWVLAGDDICVGNVCTPSSSGQSLAARQAGATVDWTASHFRLDPWRLAINRPLLIEMLPATTMLAFNSTSSALEVIEADPDGRAEIHSTGQTWSGSKLVYFALFSALIVFLLNAGLWIALRLDATSIRGSTAAIVIIMAFYYYLFFPGLFFSDTVFTDVNGGGYSIWYSSAYMTYSYLISPAGPACSQLPMVVLVTLMLVDMNESIHRVGRPPIRMLLSALLVANAALSPFLFVLAFCGQRYWVAAAFMIGGATFLFTGLSAEGKRASVRIGFGLAFMAIAALMRVEYIMFLGVAAAGTFLRFKRIGSSVPLRKVAVAICGFVVGATLVNYVAPRLQMDREEFEFQDSQYNLTLLLDMVKPYSSCSGSTNPRVRHGIDVLGGFTAYCSAETAEDFYWKFSRSVSVAKAREARASLQAGLLEEVWRDPAPAMSRFFGNFVRMVSQPIWQIQNQYELRTARRVGVHAGLADLMGAVWDRPHVAVAHRAAVAVARFFSEPFNVLLLAVTALVVLIYPIAFRGNLLLLSLNLAAIATAVGAIVFCPVPNWAYIVILPLWASFAPIYHVLTRDACQRR